MATPTLTLPADCTQIALCGGPYSNFGAVEAFLAATAGVPYRFCLGDMGGFGPWPDRTLDLLRDAGVVCLQGNYDYAVGHGEPECGCGYEDEADRRYAQISYDYTLSHTADRHRQWLRELPPLLRLEWVDRPGFALLLCHGSPDRVNEFVWESSTENAKIQAWLQQHKVQSICATHSGLPWLRSIPSQSAGSAQGARSAQDPEFSENVPSSHSVPSFPGFWCNVGVLGRPAHEGRPQVYYALISLPSESPQPQANLSPRPDRAPTSSLHIELRPLTYDPAPVVRAMAAEGLPAVFGEALTTGQWTTCSSVLPEAEKAVQLRVPAPHYH
ncbi:MAG: metallophosphoesterase family protein [Prochlorothrix sp.]